MKHKKVTKKTRESHKISKQKMKLKDKKVTKKKQRQDKEIKKLTKKWKGHKGGGAINI